MMSGMKNAVAGALLVISGAACSTTGGKTVGLADQVPPVTGAQEPGVAANKPADPSNLAELKAPSSETSSGVTILSPKDIDLIVEQRGGYKPDQVGKLTPVEKAELAYAFNAFDKASIDSVGASGEAAVAAARRASVAMNQIISAQTTIMLAHPELIPAVPAAGSGAEVSKAPTQARPTFNSEEDQRRAVARGLLDSNASGRGAERTPVRVAAPTGPLESDLAKHEAEIARGDRRNQRLGNDVTEAELRERIAQSQSSADLSRIAVARGNTGLAAQEIDIITRLVELETRDQERAFRQLAELQETTNRFTSDSIRNRGELLEQGRRTAYTAQDIEDRDFNRTQRGLPGFLGFLYHEVSDGGSSQVSALQRDYQQIRDDGLQRVQSQEAAADALRASSVELVRELQSGFKQRNTILRELGAARARELLAENRQTRQQ